MVALPTAEKGRSWDQLVDHIRDGVAADDVTIQSERAVDSSAAKTSSSWAEIAQRTEGGTQLEAAKTAEASAQPWDETGLDSPSDSVSFRLSTGTKVTHAFHIFLFFEKPINVREKKFSIFLNLHYRFWPQ